MNVKAQKQEGGYTGKEKKHGDDTKDIVLLDICCIVNKSCKVHIIVTDYAERLHIAELNVASPTHRWFDKFIVRHGASPTTQIS